VIFNVFARVAYYVARIGSIEIVRLQLTSDFTVAALAVAHDLFLDCFGRIERKTRTEIRAQHRLYAFSATSRAFFQRVPRSLPVASTIAIKDEFGVLEALDEEPDFKIRRQNENRASKSDKPPPQRRLKGGGSDNGLKANAA
jgi:hypothetical protein